MYRCKFCRRASAIGLAACVFCGAALVLEHHHPSVAATSLSPVVQNFNLPDPDDEPAPIRDLSSTKDTALVESRPGALLPPMDWLMPLSEPRWPRRVTVA
jgi:hypothetical protein